MFRTGAGKWEAGWQPVCHRATSRAGGPALSSVLVRRLWQAGRQRVITVQTTLVTADQHRTTDRRHRLTRVNLSTWTPQSVPSWLNSSLCLSLSLSLCLSVSLSLCLSLSLSLRFNSHLPTGVISRAKLQSNHHHQQTNTQFFTGRMPFLSPNQQCQSTEV